MDLVVLETRSGATAQAGGESRPGDPEAFAAMYRRHGERIRRYCVYRLRDRHEADDVTQETFARAWRSMPKVRQDGELYPWLQVVARNLCTDVLRRRVRSEPSADGTFESVGCFDDPADPVVEEVDRALVGEALRRLNTRHRSALVMHENDGLTSAEIAQQTGQSTSAVESVLWRARQALKKEFLALAGADGYLAGLPILGLALDQIRRAGRRASMLTRQATSWTGVSGPAVLPVAGVALTVACTAALVVSHVGPISRGPDHRTHALVSVSSSTASAAGTPLMWSRRPIGPRPVPVRSAPTPLARVPSRIGPTGSPGRSTPASDPLQTELALPPLPVSLVTPGVTTILNPTLPVAVPPTPTVRPAPLAPTPVAVIIAPQTAPIELPRLP